MLPIRIIHLEIMNQHMEIQVIFIPPALNYEEIVGTCDIKRPELKTSVILFMKTFLLVYIHCIILVCE